MSSLDLLSKYLLNMELRFDAMLYSNLGNDNSDEGHIKCSRGSQVPQPWFEATMQWHGPYATSYQNNPVWSDFSWGEINSILLLDYLTCRNINALRSNDINETLRFYFVLFPWGHMEESQDYANFQVKS